MNNEYEKCKNIFSQENNLEHHNNNNEIITNYPSKINKKVVKIDTNKVNIIEPNKMEYSTKTIKELISICKEKKIKGYSGKNKNDIIKILSNDNDESIINENIEVLPEKIYRLNYIGSKYQLLEWITNNMKEKTGWSSFANKTISDLFAGTGIVSYYFRKNSAKVISNDAELYSSIITHAFTRSIYTDNCNKIIKEFQSDLEENKYLNTIGFITINYSPYDSNERKFFTIDNAKRIDYIRNKLESIKDTISEDEYMFILASIILSADAVSNVPAVYGCFLKNFKTKAIKNLKLLPIHNNKVLPVTGSNAYNSNVLNMDFIISFESDLVYLDPPYNERQYSKNYFPLNIIAKTPEKLLAEMPLKGKTGIPVDCFISPFCKKGDCVEKAFDLLFSELKTKWIFLSYNSESIVSKEKMLDIMNKYGTASVIERDYKRFKSFEYNNDINIKEYLFCLNKS